jgi:hypothetical protein
MRHQIRRPPQIIHHVGGMCESGVSWLSIQLSVIAPYARLPGQFLERTGRQTALAP